MARRKANRATQLDRVKRQQAVAALMGSNSGIVTTTGRRRNITGVVAGLKGLTNVTGRRVSAQHRVATRGEATRYKAASKVGSRSRMRKLGHLETDRTRNIRSRRKVGLFTHNGGIPGGTRQRTRSQKRRDVFVATQGRSRSAARTVFNRLHPRDRRGRFRRK